jgi:hypothetical protein
MGCGGSKSEPAFSNRSTSDGALAGGDITISTLKELNFDSTMADSDGVKAMIDFAASEFADENMLFWAAYRDFAAAEGDDVAKQGAEIVDKFLCGSAEMQVNLPSALFAPFSKKSSEGDYEWKSGMFGDETSGQVGEIYRLIRNDTFSRFKFSDRATELLEMNPSLAAARKPEEEEEDEDDEPRRMARKSRADTTLAGTLRDWMDDCSCVRVTLWMIDHVATPPRMFNVAGTQLGNAMISIKVGIGLAGRAAASGEDIKIADAYEDPTFNRSVDLATGFKTKQVCCVVLRKAEGGKPIAVAQLVNKAEDAKEQEFTDADIASVRKSEKKLLPLFEAYENTRASQWGDVVA